MQWCWPTRRPVSLFPQRWRFPYPLGFGLSALRSFWGQLSRARAILRVELSGVRYKPISRRKRGRLLNSGIPPIFDLPGISLVMSSSSLEKAPAVTSGRLEQNLNQRSPGNPYNAGPVQSTTGTQRPRDLPKKGTSGLSLAGRQQPFLRRSG
jgi:hypothetical protein